MGITIKKEGLRQLRALGSGEAAYVKAGILAGAKNAETDQLVAPYAVANEFGSSKVPARPFLRSTVDACADTWAAALAQRVGKALESGQSLATALDEVGAMMAEDIRATIRDGVSPANAENTRKQKSGKGTLVKTGALLGAVKYEVVP